MWVKRDSKILEEAQYISLSYVMYIKYYHKMLLEGGSIFINSATKPSTVECYLFWEEGHSVK